jgi:hypothetical protein
MTFVELPMETEYLQIIRCRLYLFRGFLYVALNVTNIVQERIDLS